MNNNSPKIRNNVQYKKEEAWTKLCEYIEIVHQKEADEFAPREYLGDELFAQIFTLPPSIGKLKKVKKMWLYGSNLKRIPPEIGQMKSLEYFDPYTSYDLKWFPYELTKCKNLKDSRISTRALFGNFKNKKPFPDLEHNPVRYEGAHLYCSVCEKQITYEETNQLWITLRIGTDFVPLLTNLCSKECEHLLPKPPEGYVQFPHKGGANWKQPSYKESNKSNMTKITHTELEKMTKENKDKKPTLLKLIRKIWEK